MNSLAVVTLQGEKWQGLWFQQGQTSCLNQLRQQYRKGVGHYCECKIIRVGHRLPETHPLRTPKTIWEHHEEQELLQTCQCQNQRNTTVGL